VEGGGREQEIEYLEGSATREVEKHADIGSGLGELDGAPAEGAHCHSNLGTLSFCNK
jgi:hypothetical protein